MSISELNHVQTSDGIRTAVHLYTSDETEALPIIALHGLTRNARDFEEIVPDILTTGRSLALIDVRGRGQSDFDPDPMRYHPLTYAQDVLACLDHLGWDKAVFMGTSMGGLISMTLAAFAPDRLGGLLLNDIGPELGADALEQIRQMLLSQRGPYDTWSQAIAATRESNQHAFPDEHSDDFWVAFARRLCRERDDGKIHFDYDPFIREPYREPPDVPDLWPLFDGLPDIPLSLIRGELSPLVSRQAAERMQDHRPGLTYTEVPRVGHAPLLSEPEARQAIADFLNRTA